MSSLTVRETNACIQEVIDLIHKASGERHYRIRRVTERDGHDDARIIFCLQRHHQHAHSPHSQAIITPGAAALSFPQRIAVYYAHSDQGRHVTECWGLWQSPLPSRKSGELFHAREVLVPTRGALIDFLFLHLCASISAVRSLEYLRQLLGSSGQGVLPPSFIKDHIDLQIMEVPARSPWLIPSAQHEQDSDPPPRVVFKAQNTSARRSVLLQIAPDLSLIIHPWTAISTSQAASLPSVSTASAFQPSSGTVPVSILPSKAAADAASVTRCGLEVRGLQQTNSKTTAPHTGAQLPSTPFLSQCHTRLSTDDPLTYGSDFEADDPDESPWSYLDHILSQQSPGDPSAEPHPDSLTLIRAVIGALMTESSTD